MPRTDHLQRTPRKPSEEASREQLQLANEQGHTYRLALQKMTGEVAEDGGEQAVGDYLVGYAVEEAEGMWMMENGKLEWHEPGEDENCHLEIVVRDGADGRFLPCLEVEATLTDSRGQEAGTHTQPFIWHPWLFHYGRNWHLPGDGDYTLKVRIAAPTFHRHDQKNGNRYASDEEVVFSPVKIKTGSK